VEVDRLPPFVHSACSQINIHPQMTLTAPENMRSDTFSLSKKFRVSVLVSCLLWSSLILGGWSLKADTYNIGDSNNLYLGFYAADAISTKSLLINLGTRENVLAGFNLDFSSASSIISQTYGSSWFTSADVYWSVIGLNPGSNVWVGKADAGSPLTRSSGSPNISVTGGDYAKIVNAVNNLLTDSTALGATKTNAITGTNTYHIAVVDNSPTSFSSYAANQWGTFRESVMSPVNTANAGTSALGGIDIQQWTFNGILYTNQTTIGMVSQRGGLITISSLITNAPGSYSGPWNWTAASGNWDATNNWTSNQVASNGFAVGITGVAGGGTITNNAVTNLSSLTFSNGAGAYTLTGTNAGQNLTISGGITNNSAATQTIDLSVAGEGGVIQSGTGTTVLARGNSYSGGTTLSNGAVVIGNNNALGTGAVTLSGASSLIAGVANLSTTNAMALNAAATIDTASNRWTQAGTLSGSGSLTKIGSGTLTLSGKSASYSGASTVNTGAMQVTGNLGTGTVTVNNGAALSGTGTVGGVSLQSGGILTGGVDGGVGKLTVSENLSFSAGSILNWKLADASGLAGTGYDSFDVRGTIDLTGLTTGSTLQFNILNSSGGTTGFLNNQNSQWLVASTTNSIAGFSTNDFTISTTGFTNALGGGAFGFTTNATGLYLKFSALGVDPWTGNIATGSNVISGQTITSTNNAVIGANSSRNGSVAVTNNGVWNVQGNLQVGGSTNGSGTLTIGSGGRIEANGLTISDQKGSRGLVLITNGAASDAISLGAGTVSFGAGNGTLQFGQSNAVTISNAIAGKGVISSTGTGTTTLSGNQAGFTGTNSLSSGKVVLASGVTNAGIVNIAGRGTNVVFTMNTNSVLSSTGTHAVAGLLLDNSGMAFKDSIKGKVVLSPTGVLQKNYTSGQSVAGFGAGIGAGKSFSLLAGSVTNAATLEAKITRGALDFKGTYSNNIVMAITDPSFSTVRNTIQWYDPATRTWKNTVIGNISGSNKSASIRGMNGRSFAGSFSTFLLQAKSVGILTAAEDTLAEINAMTATQINTTLAKIMGAFGYDNRTKTSWAVINHNSLYSGEDLGSSEIFDEAALNHGLYSGEDLGSFTEPGLAPLDMGASSVTIQAVPEPGTWALMILGGLALGIMLRVRRQK
jgi:autotransporter-associated beta strand protein